MQKCPVCAKVNSDMICGNCGYDASLNYETFPTLLPVNGQSLSSRRTDWEIMQKNYYRCPICGGRQFYFNQDNDKLVCVKCAREWDLLCCFSDRLPEVLPTPSMNQVPVRPSPALPRLQESPIASGSQ